MLGLLWMPYGSRSSAQVFEFTMGNARRLDNLSGSGCAFRIKRPPIPVQQSHEIRSMPSSESRRLPQVPRTRKPIVTLQLDRRLQPREEQSHAKSQSWVCCHEDF